MTDTSSLGGTRHSRAVDEGNSIIALDFIERARRAQEAINVILAAPISPLPMLIGVGGNGFECGKDSVADKLVELHGFEKKGMSDLLADALYLLNPIIPVVGTSPRRTRHMRYQALADAVGYTEAKTNPEVRRLLQTLGTDVGRNLIGDDTWVSTTAERISTARRTAQVPVVITGIRYRNEVRMIEEAGGHLVYVKRPGRAAVTHSSEGSVREEDFHLVIENYGTLNELALHTENAYRYFETKDSAWPPIQTASPTTNS